MYIKLKVTAGRHSEGDRIYKKGDIIKADESFLTKFPCKFERVATESVQTPKEERKAADTDTPDKPETDSPAAPDEDDVTAEFKGAEENGLGVKKRREGYFVFDGDDEPANAEAITNKPGVKKFISEYLAE
jgi:hypothetical protein